MHWLIMSTRSAAYLFAAAAILLVPSLPADAQQGNADTAATQDTGKDYLATPETTKLMADYVAILLRENSSVYTPLLEDPRFMEGFAAGLHDAGELSEEEQNARWQALLEEAGNARTAQIEYETQRRLIEQETWMADMRDRPDAAVTPNGVILLYQTQGMGPVPAEDATVRVHYHGTLSDGTVFDSSIDRGPPETLPLPDLIHGWREGMASVPVGSVVDIYIPPELAYGDQRVRQIPPDSALAFRIHLLGIE